MAQSPSHKFGQIIGHLTEQVMYPLLLTYCKTKGLYLDKAGLRPARKGKKVSWTDKYGNTHDLDFVIEKNGTKHKLGIPIAFIESAWRRYTKHSRNKTQEIQGALRPLFETYQQHKPFMGAVLSGVFTPGALSQLKSHGFSVLYFEYDTILKAFSKANLDVFFDEKTPITAFNDKILSINQLNNKQYNKITNYLIKEKQKEIDMFFDQLDSSVSRRVCSIRVFNLYGTYNDYFDINSAISALTKSKLKLGTTKFMKIEIIVKFDNGDKVDGAFSSKSEALNFLSFFCK